MGIGQIVFYNHDMRVEQTSGVRMKGHKKNYCSTSTLILLHSKSVILGVNS